MKSNTIITNLTCNFLNNPIGIDTRFIRLGWMLESNEPRQKQTAYRILASSDPHKLTEDNGDYWDSGVVGSVYSVDAAYAGKPLSSGERCYWKVCVFDKDGHSLGFSEPAFFEAGLLSEADWKAKWISGSLTGSEPGKSVPAPYLRKTFKLGGKIESARMYVCGVGYHDIRINGSPVSEEVLAPPFTAYDKSLLYSTFDVTGSLNEGVNAIGVILGNGWYNCFTEEVWSFKHAPWRHHPKLILQLRVKYSDGGDELILSDKSWKTAASPIIFDALRNGESYDARLEIEGWDISDFDDSGWKNASIPRSPGGVLKPASLTPIKVTDSLPSVGLIETEPGGWVFDIGQNISGWAKLNVSGPAGTEITMRYSEKIKEDGDIDVSNINQFVKSGDFQTDRYVLKGDGVEEWHPRFTYHGFRYVKVTGLPSAPEKNAITGQFVHTAFDRRGSFECSNELLNKIQTASLWATLSNYHGIPTDCPHREKNGWTGDASLSAEQVLMNFNPMSAYSKWMSDFQDAQRASGQLPGIVPTGGWGFNWGSGPAWDSAMILIPWYLYVYCGDTSVMTVMYDNMKRYIHFMGSMANIDSGGYLVNFGLGDWCPPNRKPDKPLCPVSVTDTAYFYVDTLTVSKCATILGHNEDAGKFASLAGKIRESFRDTFIKREEGLEALKNQTGLSCALYQGLTDESEEKHFTALLKQEIKDKDMHIDCGILGAKYIMNCLTDLCEAEYAYDMAAQDSFPSWGNWIARGATTLWETWNGDSSQNHHMFSDISAWFYKCLAGINPDPAEPGFKHIILTPNPVRDLMWVKAHHDSMYGRISVEWKIEGNGFNIDISIPANTRATLFLPAAYSKNINNSKAVTGQDKYGRLIFEFDSGGHSISSQKS